jgi:hypothetical protein
MSIERRITSVLRVRKVEERTSNVWLSGHGDSATFKGVSLGWWVVLENNVAVLWGDEQPPISAGDCVRLTLELA